MEAEGQQPSAGAAFRLLGRPIVALGMAAASLFFMGQFSLFTYLRPFLETVTRVDVSVLSLFLLMMRVTGFIGTSLIGGVLNASLYRTLIVLPLAMAGIPVALIVLGGTFAAVAVLLGLWGLLATSAPVGWWTWLAHAAEGRGSRRRPHGGDCSTRDHAWRDTWRPALRFRGTPSHLRHERGSPCPGVAGGRQDGRFVAAVVRSDRNDT